jgi:hypothetical protein
MSEISNVLETPTECFSVATLQMIETDAFFRLQNKELTSAEKKVIRSYVIDYVKKYYYEVKNGDYFFYDVELDEFEFKEQKSFKKEVSDKLNEGAFSNYFRTNSDIYTFCSKLKKPRVFKEGSKFYINCCKGFMHKKYKAYSTYSEDIKKNVDKMLNYIKSVSCDNDELLYQAYLKYLAQLCQGKKTGVIIYKKSDEGTGKSMESGFLMDWVLGKSICLISGTEPLLTNFNLIFLGKLFVIFEELPTFTASAWDAAAGKLRTLTTENKSTYRGLYKDAIEAENISNFNINTNVDALKSSDGRRIIIMPITNKYVGNYAFFKDIIDSCFNNEVGEAFFSLMNEIDTDEFYGQRDFPETENKRIVRANLLHPVYKFLKFEYVLKNQGIEKIKPAELHLIYEMYCRDNNIKYVMGKNDFIKKLENVEIKLTKAGTNYIRVSCEELKAISIKNKWLCAYDEEEENDDAQKLDPFICDDDIVSVKDLDMSDYKIKCSNLEKQVQALKKELQKHEKKSKLDFNIV